MPTFHSSIYEGAALFSFRIDDDWLRLRVRSHQGRYGHTFLCRREAFTEWINSKSSAYLDMDCGNFLKARQYDGVLTLEFYWLSRFSDDHVHGQLETVYLRKDEVLHALHADGSGRFFSHHHRYDKPTRLNFSSAQSTLHRVIQSPAKRRALCKLLASHSGGYCGENIKVYSDGQDDFYFVATMSHNRSYNGGFILHSGNTRDGHPYVRYGVHT